MQLVARTFTQWRLRLHNSSLLPKHALGSAAQRAFAHRLLAHVLRRWQAASRAAQCSRTMAAQLQHKLHMRTVSRHLVAWLQLCQRSRDARQRAAKLLSLRNTKVRSAAWRAWRHWSLRAQSVSRAIELASCIAARQRKQRCMAVWRRVSATAAASRQQASALGQQRRAALLAQCFDSWTHALAAACAVQHRAELLQKRHQQCMLCARFGRWREEARRRRHQQGQVVRAAAFWVRWRLAIAVQSWHAALDMARKQAQDADQTIEQRNHAAKVKALTAWRLHLATCQCLRRLKAGVQHSSGTNRATSACALVFVALWTCSIDLCCLTLAELLFVLFCDDAEPHLPRAMWRMIAGFVQRRQRCKLHSAFQCWHRQQRHLAVARQQASELQQKRCSGCLRTSWQTWRQHFAAERALQCMQRRVEMTSRRRLLVHSLAAWRLWTHQLRRLREALLPIVQQCTLGYATSRPDLLAH